jgi:uncharacterized protein YaaW (UPF0174 family)
MSMGNDRTLSAEQLAVAASTLVDRATIQQDTCDELLRKLETALNAFDRSTTELTRDMPNKIAKQAAQDVVQRIADEVKRSVTDVLRPAEAKAQTLLSAMEEAVATYRSAAWRCIFVACLSGAASAVLVVLAMKIVGIV